VNPISDLPHLMIFEWLTIRDARCIVEPFFQRVSAAIATAPFFRTTVIVLI
jgi:hypothetical protein